MGLPYFGSTTLRFQVTFNLVTGYFDIVDLLSSQYNSVYGLTTANCKELLKISFAGSGISSQVVYMNKNWVAGTFGAPDINGTTPTWTYSADGSSAIDSDGNFYKGTYTFESKVTFDNGATIYSTSNTYIYGYTPILPDIEEAVDCKLSTLISEDVADYDYNGVTPTIVYAHTITAPTGSGITAPGTTAYAKRVIGGGNSLTTILWSKTWQIYFSNILTYAMQVWGTFPFIVIYDVVTGYKNVDIECSANCCDVRQCVLNLTNLWKSYEGVNPNKYAEIGLKLQQINVEWMNFEFAQGCGEDYDSFCTNLVEICKSEGCSTPSTSDVSAPIWPVLTSSGGGTTPSTFSFSLSNVTYIGTSTGSPADLHWYTDGSTYLYLQQNIAGTWTSVSGNLYVTSTAAPTPANIILNDTPNVGTDAGTTEKVLDTITFNPDDYADAVGDMIHVYALFELAQNGNGKTMKLYWGGDIIVQKFTDMVVNSVNNMVELEMWITRTGDATQDIRAKMQMYNEVASTYSTNTKTMISNEVIEITGQNTVATANDIIARKFVIDVVKVFP